MTRLFSKPILTANFTLTNRYQMPRRSICIFSLDLFGLLRLYADFERRFLRVFLVDDVPRFLLRGFILFEAGVLLCCFNPDVEEFGCFDVFMDVDVLEFMDWSSTFDVIFFAEDLPFLLFLLEDLPLFPRFLRVCVDTALFLAVIIFGSDVKGMSSLLLSVLCLDGVCIFASQAGFGSITGAILFVVRADLECLRRAMEIIATVTPITTTINGMEIASIIQPIFSEEKSDESFALWESRVWVVVDGKINTVSVAGDVVVVVVVVVTGAGVVDSAWHASAGRCTRQGTGTEENQFHDCITDTDAFKLQHKVTEMSELSNWQHVPLGQNINTMNIRLCHTCLLETKLPIYTGRYQKKLAYQPGISHLPTNLVPVLCLCSICRPCVQEKMKLTCPKTTITCYPL